MVEARTSHRIRSTRNNTARRATRTRTRKPVDQPTPAELRGKLDQLQKRSDWLDVGADKWWKYMASLLDVSGADEHERLLLAYCQIVFRNSGSCDQAGGELITTLVFDYIHKGALTPERVQKAVDEFLENHEYLVEDTKRAYSAHLPRYKGALDNTLRVCPSREKIPSCEV
ncbi:MAG: hypothetical protein ACR2JB_06010 [Bryobacteraceae bacterium]